MVSSEAIEKLRLKIEKHPKPYKLKWLNQDRKVIVDERYLISFSIGNIYFDSVWFGVVYINACHIVLDGQ
jgi:hypothetical protein